MRVLVTGATGFVMSVLVASLVRDGDEVTAVDVTEPDEVFFGLVGGRDRVRFHRGDVRDASAMAGLVAAARPDAVVHGATVTHVPEWEPVDPVRYADVNIGGTVAVLDAARKVPSVRRFVYVSSGAVYGVEPGEEPVPESGPPAPAELYGVTKLSAELLAGRFAALYDLEIPVVRFTKVFGPMERPTHARALMSVPYHLAAAAVAGRPARVTPRSLEASADWLSATDVAAALTTLLHAPEARSVPYNLATGVRTPLRDLASWFGVDLETAPDAPIDLDPAARHGKNAPYAVTRARSDLGWRPRPLQAQVAEYLTWAKDHPSIF